MSRLQKKCLVGSLLLHGVLFLVLLVGTAFLSSKQPMDLPPIVELVNVTDGVTRGGNPAVQVPPPSVQPDAEPPRPAPPVEKPEPEPPRIEKIVEVPKPEPVKPEPKPEPPKIKPVEKAEIPEPDRPKVKPTLSVKETSKPVPKQEAPRTPKVDLNKVVTQNTATKAAEAQREAKERAEREAQQRREMAKNIINGAVSNIRSQASTSTTVEMPGAGGEAFVNYASFVQAVYDRAWSDPEEVADSRASVKVSITIENRGNVLSARIIKSSGIPALDRSVQRALDRVRFVRAFPDGSKDRERTFIINFNLQAKRLTG